MDINQSQSDDEDCDGALVISEDSPRKRKYKKICILPEEEEIIANIENDLEKALDEKAAKSNLSKIHVKNILRQVVRNEHVVAMIRQAENPEEDVKLPFEPKLTRAKSKQLFVGQALNSWASPNSTASETQVLISEELQDDSSGDEYIPCEEDSEDDKDVSVHNKSNEDIETILSKSTDCATQTTLTGDEVFKVPRRKEEKVEEETNIARRTRSKLCLSNTPLEVIEESFIPPDITTDMYDMDCDDDDWSNFLKQFTRPLEEVSKNGEDEDHDPEYNVLADEGIDAVDKEELRVDKGVKVTRKELNALIAELFDYADNYNVNNTINNHQISNKPVDIPSEEKDCQANNYDGGEFQLEITILNENYVSIQDDQKLLLQQQLRQHVQLLTQGFLLTFEHPEYHDLSMTYKKYLNILSNVYHNKSSSYTPYNLNMAVELITAWENKFSTKDDSVKEYKEHVERVLLETKQAKAAGKFYVPTFPKYFLETASKSSVFLYPSLLPKIAMKPFSCIPKAPPMIDSENELIAIGLEQFIPFLKLDPNHVNSKGEVKLKDVSFYITKYMLPCKDSIRLYKYILDVRKNEHDNRNPIKYCFDNNMAPPTTHFVVPLETIRTLPPCMRSPDLLPEQWRSYVYPEPIVKKEQSAVGAQICLAPITKTVKPPVFNPSFSKKGRLKLETNWAKKRTKSTNSSRSSISTSASDELTKADIVSCTSNKTKSVESRFVVNKPAAKLCITERLRTLKFNTSIFEKLRDINMLPSMPSLGTPSRCSPELEECYDFETNDVKENVKTDNVDDVEDKSVDNKHEQKDDMDEVNAFMAASSTIKNSGKKRATVAEKKKAKLRRDFNASLRMLSPEDEDESNEKTNRFIQAFYDKVQEQLELDEYHKFMEALNDFDEKHHTYKQLYSSVANIIGAKHPDILDEFLIFFTSLQAKTMGKLVPYLILNSMSLFLRKLELFFKDQPSQVRRIYRALTELVANKEVTMSQVKNSVLPLLKGNGLLTDWFLQIFPNEKPSARLLNRDWENMEILKENSIQQDDFYETITIPEIEDPYGGPNCICSCHSVDDDSFKTRSRHCIPCGVKFMQGRVFVQTGKGLRTAKVSFDDDSIDHTTRLSSRVKLRRNECSPSKQISPGKDSQDENRLSSDEEPEKKHQRLLKSTKKRKPKKTIVEKAPTSVQKQNPVIQLEKDENYLKKSNSDHVNENTSDSSMNEMKQPIEENLEWDCNTSVESVEIKLSPEHASAESESEFCEETSQDNNTDTDASDGESSENLFIQWTRDEDKIILETFQKEEDKEQAITKISQVLENRTVSQIRHRFEMLINLLRQMSKKT